MLVIDSNFADAHYKKAAALDDLHRFDDALEEYETSIKLSYMLPECHFYRGVIY